MVFKSARYSNPLSGRFIAMALISMLFPAPVWAEILTIDEAVRLASSANPGLASMKSRAQAMAEIPLQVGTLPDPVLSLNEINLPVDTFSRTQEAMTLTQLGIAQALPFPGKLGLREQAAGFEANAAAFDAGEMQLVVIRNTQLTWWDLFFLDRAISIVQRNQVLLRQFVKIAEAKYKTGQGLQSDVLLAQVELSKLLDVEITLKASRRDQAARMNALLNRPANLPVELPDQGDEAMPLYPDADLLHRQALDARPLLAAQRQMLDAAHSRVDLAEKDYYPDFMLGAAYGFRQGVDPTGKARSDLGSIMLSMNLPLYTDTKQDRALAQRKAEVVKEEFGLQDQLVQVDAEIEQALADYRAGHDQASLFKTGIIPQARQTVASMLASYQVSQVDFLNLVRAQITLYNYETQYWKALSSGWQAWARLEAAVGRPIAKTGQKMMTTDTIKETGHE